MTDPNISVKNARRHCLDCAAGSRPSIIWCPCHGCNGTRCEFWAFRFGMQPSAFRRRYGDRLLTPESMPDASIEVELLPGTLEQAATAEINLDGYHQSAVSLPAIEKRVLTREERDAISRRLRKGREKQRGAA